MKKEEYREARREFGETAAGLGKEVRKEAREAYRNVRESADTRMKEIKVRISNVESQKKSNRIDFLVRNCRAIHFF